MKSSVSRKSWDAPAPNAPQSDLKALQRQLESGSSIEALRRELEESKRNMEGHAMAIKSGARDFLGGGA